MRLQRIKLSVDSSGVIAKARGGFCWSKIAQNEKMFLAVRLWKLCMQNFVLVFIEGYFICFLFILHVSRSILKYRSVKWAPITSSTFLGLGQMEFIIGDGTVL